jgi:hypothetical protein
MLAVVCSTFGFLNNCGSSILSPEANFCMTVKVGDIRSFSIFDKVEDANLVSLLTSSRVNLFFVRIALSCAQMVVFYTV